MSSLINHLAKTDDRIGELTQRKEPTAIALPEGRRILRWRNRRINCFPQCARSWPNSRSIASASLVRLRLKPHYLLRPNLSRVAVL
jgi:hypothetical protein